jgi:peptide-methionine (S)-S-oxide reductase
MATVSRGVLGLLVGLAVTAVVAAASRSSSQNEIRTTPLPAPQADAPLASASTPATAVVAGGCFWGIEAVFDHVRGVKTAVSGYSGGAKETAHYQMVGNGRTGHAESVQISYDSSVVTYGQLLQIFFSVHDPTQLNRQGPDEGTEYRSVIFAADADQERLARAYIAQLEQAGVFGRRIVTDVAPLKGFYAAESYHQNYAALHPDDPYIRINDAPKVVALRKLFPSLYAAR